MSTELVPYESPTSRTLALVEPAAALVERLCRTNFVPAAYRGKPDEALAAVLTGEGLGLDPMTALREIHVISGTPALSAKAMRGLLQAAGHEIWVEESSSERCVMAGRRRGSEHVQRVVWTMDDARKATLDKKDNWRHHPADMLIARATGRLCRLLASEVLIGLSYAIEEVTDGFVDEEPVAQADDLQGPPEDAPPAPKPNNRRKAPAKRASKPPAKPPARADAPADPVDEVDELDAMANPVVRGDEDGGKSSESKRAQMVVIRVKETLGREPDRDERLELVSASLGRKVASTKDLTSEDVDALLVDLDRLKAGQLEWEDGVLSEVVVPDEDDPGPAPADDDGDRLDAEGWRALVKAHGKKVPQVIRHAHQVADELGVDKPGTFDELVDGDPGLVVRVRAFVEGSDG